MTSRVFLLLILMAAAAAQTKPTEKPSHPAMGSGPRPAPVQAFTVDSRLEQMTADLKLTPAQQKKIRPLLEAEGKQMADLGANPHLAREERFAKAKEIRTSTHSKIRPLLNADQQKKWDEMLNAPKPPSPHSGSEVETKAPH